MSTVKSRFARRAIPVSEALSRIAPHARPLPDEEVPIASAVGRRIAEAVHADAPLPHFPRSGMDGYAVRSEDTAGASPEAPAKLKVIGSIGAGDPADALTVEPGTAVRIMTGGAVPAGATGVVMLEQTNDVLEHGVRCVEVKASVAARQNIAYPGDEVREGQALVARGTLLLPGQLSLLAAYGRSAVRAYRKPRVGIVSTGSELVELDQPLARGKIRNSNAYMLAAQVQQHGGEPILYGVVPDDPEQAAALVRQARQETDLLVTSGGVSVGDYDVMARLFEQWGDAVLFDKVAMRPGAPTSAACHDGFFVFGLSGNPGACFVGFELFVRPVLHAMQGAAFGLPSFSAVLAADFPKKSPHERYCRGTYRLTDGAMTAHVPEANASSMMISIPQSNGLIVIPSGKGAERGTLVKVIPLDYGAWYGY